MTLTSPKKATRFFEAKLQFTTGPAELKHMMDDHENIQIIDVRDYDDYADGHIPEAINLPKGTWKTTSSLDKNKVNIVYCYSEDCHLAAAAAFEFAKQGFSVMELEGGFESWKTLNLPIVS